MTTPTSEEVIRLWLSGLRSENTKAAYDHDLRLAERIIGTRDFSCLNRAVVGSILNEMRIEGYSVNSIRRMHSTLRVLSSELAAYEVISSKEHFGIMRMKLLHPKVDRAGRYLERAERSRLFAAVPKAARDEQEVALLNAALALGLGAGLRFNEVRSLKPQDYDSSTGQVRVREAKGGKERYVYLAGEAKRLMDGVIGKGVKFTALNYDLWESLRYHAGLDGVVFHDLRRTFASDAWDAGIDGSTIAAMLGHSNIQTSMLYDRRSDERKRRAAKVMMGAK